MAGHCKASKHLATSSSTTILICRSGRLNGSHSRCHTSIVRSRRRILSTLVGIHLVVKRIRRHGRTTASRCQGSGTTSLAVAYKAGCLVSGSAGCHIVAFAIPRRLWHHRRVVVRRRVRCRSQVRRICCSSIYGRSLALVELVKAGWRELRHNIGRTHLVVVVPNVVRDRGAGLHHISMAELGP